MCFMCEAEPSDLGSRRALLRRNAAWASERTCGGSVDLSELSRANGSRLVEWVGARFEMRPLGPSGLLDFLLDPRTQDRPGSLFCSHHFSLTPSSSQGACICGGCVPSRLPPAMEYMPEPSRESGCCGRSESSVPSVSDEEGDGSLRFLVGR